MKRKLLIVLLIVLSCIACVFGITSCTQTTPEEMPSAVEVTSVTLNRTKLALEVGDSETLTATVAPSNATDRTVTWKSSNSAVAQVENGKVTALKAGTATIIAMAGYESAGCTVTVTGKVIDETLVTSVTLNKTTLSLQEGESGTLTATVAPNNATDRTVTWKSSNTTVAKVENGKVTALKAGTATITATAGGKNASCTVMVAPAAVIKAESITLNKTTLSLEVGDSETLTATVAPHNATDKTVTWESSDSTVAKVENGKVTALKAGIATITATASGKSATCKVTVIEKVIEVTSVTLNKTTLSLEVDDEETLIATVAPANATDKIMTWKSSDSSVAKVENGKVTALKAGTATITATAGGKNATCTVTVFEKSVAITAIYLNKSQLSLFIGDSETLIQTVLPLNATEEIVWISTAPSVATVVDGKITGLSEGTAIIIVSSVTGKEATCEVTVTENTNGFVFELYNDGYTVVGYNGNEKNVTLPDTYKNKKVIAIGNIENKEAVDDYYYQKNSLSESEKLARSGFYNNKVIEEIILPESILYVNAYAFAGCKNLKSVVLNEGLTNLGFGAFFSSGLKTLLLPSTVHIGFGLLGSSIESLEFKSVKHCHITEDLACLNLSLDLYVPSVSYYRGQIDAHFQVTQYSSKRVDTSATGVVMSLEYPSSYVLVDRWFSFYGNMYFLYGDYQTETTSARVSTAFDEGQNFSIYFNCPYIITGNFYLIPSTLKKVIVNGQNVDESFVKGLNVEFVNN